MTRALKLDCITKIDDTSAKVLKIISRELGTKQSIFIDFKIIGKELDVDRDVVGKAVKRMLASKILEEENGKLSIPNTVLVNG